MCLFEILFVIFASKLFQWFSRLWEILESSVMLKKLFVLRGFSLKVNRHQQLQHHLEPRKQYDFGRRAYCCNLAQYKKQKISASHIRQPSIIEFHLENIILKPLFLQCCVVMLSFMSFAYKGVSCFFWFQLEISFKKIRQSNRQKNFLSQ